MAVKVRNELKYFISQSDYLVLSRLLDQVLARDPNGDENNEYFIRSLYFDDMRQSALADKIAGVDRRDKYRIRYYNFSDKFIRLERKSKYGNYISKDAARITRDMAEQMMAGDPTGLEKHEHQLVRDMYCMMSTQFLRPVVLVDYVREAYIYQLENVRITFDKQLRTGLMSTDLFSRWQPTISPLESDVVILEVKFDRFIPIFIKNLLGHIVSQRSAISKYVLCRSFDFHAQYDT